MEDSLEQLNTITEKIIGCAIEVHKSIGPGLLESIYEKALCYELGQKGLHFKTQVTIPIIYKGSSLGEHRVDLIVED
jgi:GxxExxY protein